MPVNQQTKQVLLLCATMHNRAMIGGIAEAARRLD